MDKTTTMWWYTIRKNLPWSEVIVWKLHGNIVWATDMISFLKTISSIIKRDFNGKWFTLFIHSKSHTKLNICALICKLCCISTLIWNRRLALPLFHQSLQETHKITSEEQSPWHAAQVTASNDFHGTGHYPYVIVILHIFIFRIPPDKLCKGWESVYWTHSTAYEPRGSLSRSKGLSNNPYPEPDRPNSSYWYPFL